MVAKKSFNEGEVSEDFEHEATELVDLEEFELPPNSSEFDTHVDEDSPALDDKASSISVGSFDLASETSSASESSLLGRSKPGFNKRSGVSLSDSIDFDSEFGGETDLSQFPTDQEFIDSAAEFDDELFEDSKDQASSYYNRTPLYLSPSVAKLIDTKREDTSTTQPLGKIEKDNLDVQTSPEIPSAVCSVDMIAADTLLRKRYLYTRDGIRQGNVTLVFAQNSSGESVILRQVWVGPSQEIPQALRQRIQIIAEVSHPQLVSPRTIFTTQTGIWAEFLRPPGYRLSEVIEANGPQELSIVKQWANEIADILTTIHSSQVAYANLAADAVWVQEIGPLHIEPFDIFSFEERGSLGPFGPRELHVTDGPAHLTPASDVYSLAAVVLASLTGLPLDISRTEELPAAEKDVLKRALSATPTTRYQTAAAFIRDFNGNTSFFAGLRGRGILIGILAFTAVVLIVLASVVIFSEKPAKPLKPISRSLAKIGEPKHALVPPPGPVNRFDIIKIETSYVLNPPKGADSKGDSDDRVGDKASKKEALAYLQKLIEKLQNDSEFSKSKDAETKVKTAISKLHGAINAEELSVSEWGLINKFNNLSTSYDWQKDSADEVEQAIKDNDLSRVRSAYSIFSEVDPASLASKILNENHDWNFVTIQVDTRESTELSHAARKEKK